MLGEDEERDIIQFLTRTKVFNKERLRQAPAAIAPPGGKLAAKRLLSWVEPTLLYWNKYSMSKEGSCHVVFTGII